jgi:hypothetical protein
VAAPVAPATPSSGYHQPVVVPPTSEGLPLPTVTVG